jgi:hypothetical protein
MKGNPILSQEQMLLVFHKLLYIHEYRTATVTATSAWSTARTKDTYRPSDPCTVLLLIHSRPFTEVKDIWIKLKNF